MAQDHTHNITKESAFYIGRYTNLATLPTKNSLKTMSQPRSYMYLWVQQGQSCLDSCPIVGVAVLALHYMDRW